MDTFDGSTYSSSFDEIIESDWIDELVVEDKRRVQLKHFRIVTYDDVLEVVCEGYTLRPV